MLLKHLWPAILWAVFILILCAIPGSDLPQIWWLEILSFDKLVHAALFAIYFILLVKGFASQTAFSLSQKQVILVSIFIAVPYGFAMELMQRYLIEGRTFDLYDALANAVGCFAGWWWLSYRQKKITSAKH